MLNAMFYKNLHTLNRHVPLLCRRMTIRFLWIYILFISVFFSQFFYHFFI